MPRGFMLAPACVVGRLKMSAGDTPGAPGLAAPPILIGIEAPTPVPPTPPETDPPPAAGIEIAGSEMPPGMPVGAAMAGAPMPIAAAKTAVNEAIAIEFCAVTAVFRSVAALRSEEHTSELQSRENLVC